MAQSSVVGSGTIIAKIWSAMRQLGLEEYTWEPWQGQIAIAQLKTIESSKYLSPQIKAELLYKWQEHLVRYTATDIWCHVYNQWRDRSNSYVTEKDAEFIANLHYNDFLSRFLEFSIATK